MKPVAQLAEWLIIVGLSIPMLVGFDLARSDHHQIWGAVLLALASFAEGVLMSDYWKRWLK